MGRVSILVRDRAKAIVHPHQDSVAEAAVVPADTGAARTRARVGAVADGETNAECKMQNAERHTAGVSRERSERLRSEFCILNSAF